MTGGYKKPTPWRAELKWQAHAQYDLSRLTNATQRDGNHCWRRWPAGFGVVGTTMTKVYMDFRPG